MSSLAATPDQAVLILSSGQTLKVSGIMLYPSDDLAEVSQLKSKAAVKLGGVSTGIGFIGSPTWAVGAGVALGFLERIASDAAQKAGLELLARAERAMNAILLRGVVFPCSDIERIEQPNPNMWSIQYTPAVLPEHKPVDLNAMSRRERSIYLTGEQGASAGNHPMTYSHNGDDFISVETEFGIANIRWSGVIGYVAPARN